MRRRTSGEGDVEDDRRVQPVGGQEAEEIVGLLGVARVAVEDEAAPAEAGRGERGGHHVQHELVVDEVAGLEVVGDLDARGRIRRRRRRAAGRRWRGGRCRGGR